jgi:hypothetical protein
MLNFMHRVNLLYKCTMELLKLVTLLKNIGFQRMLNFAFEIEQYGNSNINVRHLHQ